MHVREECNWNLPSNRWDMRLNRPLKQILSSLKLKWFKLMQQRTRISFDEYSRGHKESICIRHKLLFESPTWIIESFKFFCETLENKWHCFKFESTIGANKTSTPSWWRLRFLGPNYFKIKVVSINFCQNIIMFICCSGDKWPHHLHHWDL